MDAFNVQTNKIFAGSIAYKAIKHEKDNTKNIAFHLGKYIAKTIYLPGFNIWCPISETWHLVVNFVIVTLEDTANNFSNAGKENFSYTACTATKRCFIEPVRFEQPVLKYHFLSLSKFVLMLKGHPVQRSLARLLSNGRPGTWGA